MNYQEHLKSDYWKAVSKEVKKRARYRCQTCNSGLNLEAHHRNYDFVGRELEHLDEMVCLCTRCHATFHGKTPPERVNVKAAQPDIPPAPSIKNFQYLKISRAVLLDPALNASQKILLSYMLGFKDFFASDSYMQKMLGVNKRTLENQIAELRAKGYITGKRNTRKPCFPPRQGKSPFETGSQEAIA